MLQSIFDRIKANLAEIQLKKHQNDQKMHFLQKVTGVNGLKSVATITKQPFIYQVRSVIPGCTRKGNEVLAKINITKGFFNI